MKVLVFTTLYPNNVRPHLGVFIKERMTEVARRGSCELRVVAPVPWFPPIGISHRARFREVVREEMRDGLQVCHPRYFITPKVGMALYGWMMFRSVLPLVKRIQASFDFDLIDAHYAYPDAFAATLLGRALGRPVVVSARGSDINLFSEFPIIRRLLRRTLQRAAGVIAVSAALKEKMTGLGVAPDRIAVIPNGVDARKFHPLPRDEARGLLGLPASGKLVLSVANLVPLKGFDILIEAIDILNGRRADVGLVIVGDGEQRGALERIVATRGMADRVRFAGAVPHDRLHAWYGAADVFCLASKREGWPNVILESLACGTPVVATAVGGVAEILTSERLGIMTERSAEALAGSLEQALGRTWDREAIVDYARSRTWEHAADAVIDVFGAALQAQRKRTVERAAGC